VQIVRTIIWVMILTGIMLFSFLNWKPVEITLWDEFIVETKVPALVILAFLVGLIPMWLYHRSVKWGLKRRIRSLEASIKSTALARQNDAPASPDTIATPVEKPGDNPAEAGDTLSPAAPSESPKSE
jgi:hypothetical protein